MSPRIKYRVCASCNRKRRFYLTPESHDLKDPGWRWTCSKGHTHWVASTMFERIVELSKAIYLPQLMKQFKSNEAFYRVQKPR